MEQRDKALKVAVTAVVIMASVMFAYYWVQNRTRKLDNEINLSEKAPEAPKEERAAAEFAGVYSATEPVEGLEHRLGFFSLSRKEDGSGYFGTAKVDTIGAAEPVTSYLKCDDANITDKEFFVKCFDPDLGQISFSGDTKRDANGAIQVSGHLLWSKGGTEVTNKTTTFTRTGSN